MRPSSPGPLTISRAPGSSRASRTASTMRAKADVESCVVAGNPGASVWPLPSTATNWQAARAAGSGAPAASSGTGENWASSGRMSWRLTQLLLSTISHRTPDRISPWRARGARLAAKSSRPTVINPSANGRGISQ